MNYKLQNFLVNRKRKLKHLKDSKKLIEYFKSSKVNTEFTNQLTLVAIFKNEAKYMREWIEYHKLVGIDKFILFDNDSEDNVYNILEPYILEGTVIYKKVTGEAMQMASYMEAIANYKQTTKWMCFLDLDEYLVPLEQDTMSDFLKQIKPGENQILVGWEMYGTSGFETEPEGLIIENFIKHADNSTIWDYKAIVNPRAVIGIETPHYFDVIGKTVDENHKEYLTYPYATNPNATASSKQHVRINHYFTKSKEQYFEKRRRGDGMFGKQAGLDKYNMDTFMRHDRNEVTDATMQRFVKKVKDRMINED